MKAETKTCQNCKKLFIVEPDDFDFYQKLNVPAPTWCPQCRFQRRLAFFAERALYKRTCDLCGKSMVTMYPPDPQLTVYCNECWWSDTWDPGSYWRDYDPSRPFLPQVQELIRATPQVALSVNYPTLVNSDYINHAATSKNCYLIFTADMCENVLYSTILVHNKDCADCTGLGGSELCYEDTMCDRCSRVYFSDYCNDCTDMYFSKNCNGCSNCFGCINLRNKNYHIFNEPYTKEEYTKKIKEFGIDDRANIEAMRRRAREFWLTHPHKYMNVIHSTNVSGDYVYSSKNAKDMYQVGGAEDSRFCQFLTMHSTKDAYDYTIWGNGAQRIYECLIAGEGADEVKFSNQCWGQVQDVQYSFWAVASSHMFGCANIRKKQYCILNKQYTKEEFESLRARIIQDMNAYPYVDSKGRSYPYGEFFPPEFSLHVYNETHAMEFFPLNESEIKEKGFRWAPLPVPPQAPTMTAEKVPARIADTPDSIVNEIIECAGCKKPFRIIPQELELLRRFGFPAPQHCFNCRYTARWKRINPPFLWERECANCKKAIRTSYAPDRPEIVYCEQCYQAEVV